MKRIMTPQDKQAATNLYRIWNDKKRSLGLTQEKASERLGISQSGFSQYVLGKVRLGDSILLKFSELLGVSPTDIREEFQYNLSKKTDLTADAMKLAEIYQRLPPEFKTAVFGVATSFLEQAETNVVPLQKKQASH